MEAIHALDCSRTMQNLNHHPKFSSPLFDLGLSENADDGDDEHISISIRLNLVLRLQSDQQVWIHLKVVLLLEEV
ncbi:hypothetical protein MKW98_010752 [Papaver atlanticum]|uniref:Uncharacterized protein n=1 Tax=Papaver atlanticum TaxID=357466 RepID=A0AAD4SM16_9MAGN|nr:hypothetical protein MKW98_010752 [Papaver atlanticum]